MDIQKVLEYNESPYGIIKFLNELGYILSPAEGLIKWKLYDYQREFIFRLVAYDRNLVLKSRQMGISWCIAGFVLWNLLFEKSKAFYLVSSTEDHAKALLEKVKVLYRNLPLDYRMLDPDNIRALEILNPARGTQIKSLTSGASSGRGEAAYFVFFDEFAHIQKDVEVFNSLAFSTIHGGKLCGVSTPAGFGNVFAELWHDTTNDWQKATYHYSRYPNYPYDLVAKMVGEMGKSIDQELEATFLQSGNPVFKAEDIDECHKAGKSIDIKNLKINKFYTGIDVSEGGAGGDFTSITTLGIVSGGLVEVDYLVDRIPIKDLLGPKGIVQTWHRKYPGPVVVEKNGPGIAVISDYQGEDVHPLQTTRMNKSPMINDLKYIIQNHKLGLRSDESVNQLHVYQYETNGATSAPRGYSDDAIMSLAFAIQAVKHFREAPTPAYIIANSDSILDTLVV